MDKEKSEKQSVLFDFQAPHSRGRWRIINDVVMGGVSGSEVLITEPGTLLFTGNLSLEQGGGFASARTEAPALPLQKFSGFNLRVRGDGKRYQLRLRTEQEGQEITYRAHFDTHPDTWMEIQIPFQAFQPMFRGQVLEDAPALKPETIRQLGMLIAEKQAGEFRLEMDWLKAYA